MIQSQYVDVTWPQKYSVFGVQISATNYDDAVRSIATAARNRVSSIVSLQAVHPVIVASGDQTLRDKVNSFEMIGPDGQPVRWALNLLHHVGLKDRVYGPELMLRICKAAEEQELPIYLYGSTDEVLAKLTDNLIQTFPQLQIAGAESPPFRALSDQEADEVVKRIVDSRAAIVFVGLGAPKQDEFAFEFRNKLPMPLVCVGAAFDFHAGAKHMAPAWMQRRGLEWLFRLVQEPRRLWKRYLVTNSVFVFKLSLALFTRRILRVSDPSEPLSGAAP